MGGIICITGGGRGASFDKLRMNGIPSRGWDGCGSMVGAVGALGGFASLGGGCFGYGRERQVYV